MMEELDIELLRLMQQISGNFREAEVDEFIRSAVISVDPPLLKKRQVMIEID